MQRRLITISAIFLFFLAALVFGSMFLWQFLIVSTPLNKADAIILLAGNRSTRLPAAAELFRQGYADKIMVTDDGVFSSWSKKYQRNLYNVEWSVERLVDMGVPATAV